MIRKSALFHFLLMVFTICLFEISLNSCASQSSPNGGPRDTIAPGLDTSFPANFTTNFNSNRIELIFDEYINLKNPGQQILISPLLKNKPEINLKGKTISIEFKDSLLANTTYTISFGNSIADFREGNTNKNFKYIFSTGSFIDSLSFSGHIENSLSSEPEKDLFVGLYEIADSIQNLDSLPFQNIPSYYAFTDEEGKFQMDYLKDSKFIFVAFDDSEGDFKLNGNEKTIAFSSDTIYSSQVKAGIDFHSFEPEPKLRYYGARHLSFGKISFGFNKKPNKIEIKELSSDSIIPLFANENGDSLSYWFKVIEGPDSLAFLVNTETTINDTSIIFLRDFDPPKIKLSRKIAQVKKGDTLVLKSNVPLIFKDSTKMKMIRGGDTLSMKFFPSENSFTLKIENLLIQKPAFDLVFLKNSLMGLNGEKNDSISIKYKNLKAEDLGNLDLKVISPISETLLLEIYDSKNNLLRSQKFQDSTLVKLKGFQPGKYKARVIFDKNGDGIWTTGSRKEERQPERILEYQEIIEIRANWDLELEWIMQKPKAIKA